MAGVVYGVVRAFRSNKEGVVVVTIPHKARKELGIEAGDEFVVSIEKDGLCYRKNAP